ncbi:hypothetical protein D9V41_07075 [Aeromicrobium phragmitis]|uniref:Uncharacterized protein n=1 Tax=Aeromicrobium phragmitis TaxID=2478914 RepID=A0A3L8PNC9_9ACTN|nr:permease prefix domain 1-containing protein [Aeromicrobium phragmitis]RLV56193.1 hypothetical protein D9V41_07075 [Aeromicrobium phragmitis]
MSTLTDRYVHAATRFVSAEDERTELALELRERIADTIDDLRARGLAEEQAEWQALSDLGDPLRLAAEYRGRPMQLIGPRYYFIWLRLLVTLLAIVPAAIGVIAALAAAGAREPAGDIIGTGISAALSVALQVAFWTTAVFAFIERAAPDGTEETAWSPEKLPELPDASERHRRNDLVASLVFITTMAALLVWQYVGSPFFDGETRLPILAPDLWPWRGGALLALLALEAGQALWLYRRGWTWPGAIANIAISLAFGGLLVWLFLTDRLLNPAFIEHVGWDQSWVDSATPFVVVATVAIVAWESIDALLKAGRRGRAVSS